MILLPSHIVKKIHILVIKHDWAYVLFTSAHKSMQNIKNFDFLTNKYTKFKIFEIWET